MTKPLEQIKSELAVKFIFADVKEEMMKQFKHSWTHDTLKEGFSAGFDSCLSHLASVGVSGAERLFVAKNPEYVGPYNTTLKKYDAYNENPIPRVHLECPVIEFIELLPVAAQLSKQAERIAELENKIKELESK